MIDIQHISKSFDGRVILDDISLVFEEGKTNLVIGSSGSGKTVLMKCLVSLYQVDQGQILYDGRDFTESSEEEKREIRKDFGMVFQGQLPGAAPP